MSDESNTNAPADHDTRQPIFHALCTWSGPDIARLSALISLGPPSQLHAAAPPAPVESGEGPGGVREVWRTGRADRVRADVLHAWRVVSEGAGAPLPPPGRV